MVALLPHVERRLDPEIDLRNRSGAPTPAPARLIETHSSIVVFVGDHAYKLKKPVDLGFLDFSTRARREVACHREVALNQRLAPDVYEGVADVIGPDGTPLDHLVVMRRMPDDRRLAVLASGGSDLDLEMRQLARLLAAFHAASPRSEAADRAATSHATRLRWSANTDQLRALVNDPLDVEEVERIQRLAARYIDGRQRLFDQRIASGRCVDGHGDLLADDIFCLDDGPRALDCLDFDDSLRLGDGLSDLASLAMDLERLGRPDLARTLLDAYVEHSSDVWPSTLVHHHIAYRAQVRAKVAALRQREGAPEAAAALRQHLELALGHLRAGRVRLVLVGGPPGAGKTTVAAALADRFDGVMLRADVVRKELAGVDSQTRLTAPLDEGRYSPSATQQTYAELLSRAEVLLSNGSTVVLDATWAHRDLRDRALGLAARTLSDAIQLCCWAPTETCDERIRERLARGTDPSDATPAVAEHVRARFAPWPTATTLDTTLPLDETLERATTAVGAWPLDGMATR